MPSLITIINIVLEGQNNFCCLCFSTDQNIVSHDEMDIKIIETELNVCVTSVLHSIFGIELHEYLSIFNKICDNCLQSIISIYTFIQSRHYNAKMLIQALDGLYNNTDKIKSENGKDKSLYVTVDLENFTSKQIYDNEMPDSIEEALKRFNILTMPRSKQVFTNKLSLTSKSKFNEGNIKTSEMLLNQNDPFVYKCKECFKEYPSMLKLRNHFLKIHTPKDYKCFKCEKLYSSLHLLDYHISMAHSKIVCDECSKTFKNSFTYKKHQKSHHREVVCSKCGRTYKSKVTYKKHIQLNKCKQEDRANPANAQFTCDYCGKKYTQKMSLRVHIQYNHGNYKSHVCTWCEKKFWAQSRLKAHIIKHTKEKNFTCSTCQRKFVTKESLLYHTRLHTGEKPYNCPKCNSLFVSSSRRAYHMRTFHVQDAEECEICHSKFTSQIYLNKHKKTHEQMQIKKKRKQKPVDEKDASDNIKADKNGTKKMEEKSSTVQTLLDHVIEMPGLSNDEEGDNESYIQQFYQKNQSQESFMITSK